MKLGNSRLLALVLAVLPPLQREQAPQCAAEAVEAVLFERCGPLLHALVAAAYGADDDRDPTPGPVGPPHRRRHRHGGGGGLR